MGRALRWNYAPSTQSHFAGEQEMVKIWIHKHGGTEPHLVTEKSLRDCVAQFDLEDATFMQPLDERSPTASAPGPLGTDPNPKLVVFEVFTDEQTEQIKSGYYASGMIPDVVQELLTED
jgi:hypothetical protein